MRLNPLSLPNNTEQYKKHIDKETNFECYEYYYRNKYGKFFSCIGLTIKECRLRRDVWLENEERNYQNTIKKISKKN
jgi:hypothetical protein